MSRSKKGRKRRTGRSTSPGLGSEATGGFKASSRKTPRAGDGWSDGVSGRERQASSHAGLAWLASKGPVVRFVLVFSLLIAVFYAVYLPFIEMPWFKTYLAVLAEACGAILGLLGREVVVNERWITAPAFSMEIVSGCDGLEATALFVSAVLASPVPLRSRLVFMFIGTGVLMVINLGRIVSLFYIGVYFPKALDRMHFDAWPGLLIVLILGCWLIWARWAGRTRGPHADSTI